MIRTVKRIGALASLVLGAGPVCAADAVPPTIATPSAPAATQSAPATQPPPAPQSTATTPTAPAGEAARKEKAATPKPSEKIELDTTQITGNKELPKVMYVVPWKKSDMGDFGGRPAKSLLDEALAPVDRDVFRRQTRYYHALQPDAAAAPAAAP